MEKLLPEDEIFISKLTESEIKEKVRKHLAIARDNQIKPGIVAYEYGHAQLTLAELERRTADRFSRTVIIVSLVTLFTTVIFSWKDYSGDKGWQREQIEELRSIKSTLEFQP